MKFVWAVTRSFYTWSLHEQQAESKKKSMGDRERRLGEFWSMLKHFGALWS